MNVVIINTNCANLYSVQIMLNNLKCNAIISDDPKIILQADKLLLPGVGTAKAAMNQLKAKKLIQLIKNYDRPILGICLGMQLLGSKSEENNHIKTLNIINIPIKRIQSNTLPIPHMGWNNITILKEHILFYGIKKNHYFYFSHSYMMAVCQFTIAQSDYGQPFSAAIQYKNFFGVQFHPEKSSVPGRQLIKNFLEISSNDYSCIRHF